MSEAVAAEVAARTPCPFCGGEPVYCFNGTRPEFPMHWILCRDCHACPGDRPTAAAAWTLWNTRSTPATDAGEMRERVARALYPTMVAGGHYNEVPIDEAFSRPRYAFLANQARRGADAILALHPAKSYREGLEDAAIAIEMMPEEILFWDRPGGPPGNGYRPITRADMAATIRALGEPLPSPSQPVGGG